MAKKNFKTSLLVTIPVEIPAEITLAIPATSQKAAHATLERMFVEQVNLLIKLGKLKSLKVIQGKVKVNSKEILKHLKKEGKISSFTPGKLPK